MRTFTPKVEEKAKRIWLYCDDCGFQKASSYFNPPICPRCNRKLRFLQLTKNQFDKYYSTLRELGCKEFAKKYMRRGEFING